MSSLGPFWLFLFVYSGFPRCFQGGINYAAASDLGRELGTLQMGAGSESAPKAGKEPARCWERHRPHPVALQLPCPTFSLEFSVFWEEGASKTLGIKQEWVKLLMDLGRSKVITLCLQKFYQLSCDSFINCPMTVACFMLMEVLRGCNL